MQKTKPPAKAASAAGMPQRIITMQVIARPMEIATGCKANHFAVASVAIPSNIIVSATKIDISMVRYCLNVI